MFRAQLRPDLYLSLLEERHASTVYALVNHDREYLREWLPWVDATHTEDDTGSFIRSSLERFASNNGIAAGIWHRGDFCGVIGTHNIDWLNRRVEIGYWLAGDSQGQGVITDACRAMITYAFGELDLHRVEIRCGAENVRS